MSKQIPKLPPELERHRMVSVPLAAQLMGISEDTFERHYAHLIRQVSPRRKAVRVGDVIDDSPTVDSA
jgi:hypothetical protein